MMTDAIRFTGKWTKLLKAFAMLYGLEHLVEVGSDGDVLISVIIKNVWYESVIDVFENGKAACVSSLSKYVFADASKSVENIVEAASKEILEGTFGEGRYLKSFKGGGCKIISYNLVEVPYFIVKDLSRNLDELLIRLDLVGIDLKNVIVEPKESKWC